MHLGNGLLKPAGDVGQRLKNNRSIYECQSGFLHKNKIYYYFSID